MGNRAELENSMPAMLLHEGVWEGRYRFVDLGGNVTDEYSSRIECTFPDDGPYAYVSDQRSHRSRSSTGTNQERNFWKSGIPKSEAAAVKPLPSIGANCPKISLGPS